MRNWTMEMVTEPFEVDTGHSDKNGEKIVYNRLGTLKFVITGSDGMDTTSSVHINDTDSLFSIAQKLTACGSRINYRALSVARKDIGPFLHKLNKGGVLDKDESSELAKVLDKVREIVHEVR